jgi:hypothetical protein
MKVEFNNLYSHFIFTTLHREAMILEKHRDRIEKYITGIVHNNGCQLYAIYANPEHHKKQSFAEEFEQFIKFYQKTLKIPIR